MQCARMFLQISFLGAVKAWRVWSRIGWVSGWLVGVRCGGQGGGGVQCSRRLGEQQYLAWACAAYYTWGSGGWQSIGGQDSAIGVLLLRLFQCSVAPLHPPPLYICAQALQYWMTLSLCHMHIVKICVYAYILSLRILVVSVSVFVCVRCLCMSVCFSVWVFFSS